MPRRPKGPHLYWRARKDGPSVWQIRDGSTRVSTGTDSRPDAEKQLADYIQRKHRPSGPTEPAELAISMALALYAEEHAVTVSDPARIGYAIDALDRYWADSPVSHITGNTCRAYAKARGASDSTIRRELGVLSAALNHCHREGYLTTVPAIVKPKGNPRRERYLTRSEAAWLLRGARALNKDGKHLQDFILHGLYMGSRKETILRLTIGTPSIVGGHVDLENGLLFRKPAGKTETTKRQPTCPIPSRYLAHLRRQHANGRKFVVERRIGDDRTMVGDIRKGWSRAIDVAESLAKRAGQTIDLSDVVPHTLRHTAITWALQGGAPIWEVAGYFGASVKTIESNYGHHAKDHMQGAVLAMNRGGKRG